MKGYVFEYLNENDFNTKERTLRKYNKLAYKKLIFEYYKELRNGNFIGTLVDKTDDETFSPSIYS